MLMYVIKRKMKKVGGHETLKEASTEMTCVKT